MERTTSEPDPDSDSDTERSRTRSRLHRARETIQSHSQNIAAVVLGHLAALVLFTQSAAAQEGLQAAAETVCVDRVASLASLGYFTLALALALKGLFMIISPKDDKDTSRKEARSTRMKGVIVLGIGVLAGAIPPILAGAGIVDLTGCVAPEHIGA